MKKLVFIIMALTVMPIALPCSAAATQPDPQASRSMTSDMTVAELEAKGDALRRYKDYDKAMQMYRMALRT